MICNKCKYIFTILPDEEYVYCKQCGTLYINKENKDKEQKMKLNNLQITLIEKLFFYAQYLRNMQYLNSVESIQLHKILNALDNMEMLTRQLEDEDTKKIIEAYVNIKNYECLYAYVLGLYHSQKYYEKKELFKNEEI